MSKDRTDLVELLHMVEELRGWISSTYFSMSDAEVEKIDAGMREIVMLCLRLQGGLHDEGDRKE